MNRRKFLKRGLIFVPASFGIIVRARAQSLNAADGPFIAAPPSSGAAGTDFFTVSTLGTLRNNFSGEVGCQFVMINQSVSCVALGRWVVSGNSGTHTVRLFNGSCTQVASVSVNTSGKPAGAFAYVTLGTPVTLVANGTYSLSSTEANGGDQWYDADTVITGSKVTSLVSSTTPPTDSACHVGATQNRSYVPVNLLYTT